MDVLEKALLVDELKHLIVGLNDNKASLFEIAKSKQRIKDICASCNDPLFQDELTAFKEFMQQEEFSKQDLEDYGFSMTYRGTYNFMGRVESALFASADMGWAALRQSQHWQIWVIRPSLSFLKSPWMTSTQEALEWLKKHSREFIRTDEELKIIIPVLEAHNEIPTTLSAQEQLSLLRKETANFESQLEAIIQEKIQPVTPSSNSSTVTATRPRPSFRQNSPSVANINKAKPVALKDFNLDGLLCRLERVDPKLYPSLYLSLIHI